MKYKKRTFNLFAGTFPKFPTFFYLLYLKYILKDCRTILDLGCGEESPIRFFNAKTCGVDAHKSVISRARLKKTHDMYKILDIRNLKMYYGSKVFDAVVALDVIEHLPKKDGYILLKNMENIALKKVIIFTPNGFMPQSGVCTYDIHRSGWNTKDFEKNGYITFGMYGPKSLRGQLHKLRCRPELLWACISDTMQWTYNLSHPSSAAALLAVKQFIKPI